MAIPTELEKAKVTISIDEEGIATITFNYNTEATGLRRGQMSCGPMSFAPDDGTGNYRMSMTPIAWQALKRTMLNL